MKTARKDFLATRPKEAAVESATIKSICNRIGTFRKNVKSWGAETVRLANDARAIGLFVIEFLDALPGKQLTIDFWHQFSDQFVDQHGQAISQEQLKMFVRIAQSNPDSFSDVRVAMSWRQNLFNAAGFELVSDRPPGQAQHVNFYNRFFDVLNEKKISSVLDGLESDPNYGPLESWPEERKTRAWLQIKPVYDRVISIASKLNCVES